MAYDQIGLLKSRSQFVYRKYMISVHSPFGVYRTLQDLTIVADVSTQC